jgi:hypothetical protein
MAHDGLIVPDESSVLCESCGYTLDGLPTTGQCPECGAPISQSLSDDGRKLPAWEDVTNGRNWVWRWMSTTMAILFRPGRFYRTLETRHYDEAALRFARLHWSLSAILFAGSLSIHVYWYERYLLGPQFMGGPWVIWLAAMPVTYLFLWGTTRFASRLTAWEAAYRGYRLPLPVVLRSLYYHAAHITLVAAMAFATVGGNWLAVRSKWISEASAQRYLIVLCIEVLVGAGFLFKTYWIGMKAIMYANR